MALRGCWDTWHFKRRFLVNDQSEQNGAPPEAEDQDYQQELRMKAREAEDQHDRELADYLWRIGARSLASELDDLRFRNRIIESRTDLLDIQARIAVEEEMQDQFLEKLQKNQASLFEKAQSYNNFVLTLGYAGVFTIWSFTRDQLDPWDAALIAVMAGASLALFVIWTIVQMILAAKMTIALGRVLSDGEGTTAEKLERIHLQEVANAKLGAKFQRAWLVVFAPTVLFAFAAAGCLFALLLGNLLGYTPRLHQLDELFWVVVSRFSD